MVDFIQQNQQQVVIKVTIKKKMMMYVEVIIHQKDSAENLIKVFINMVEDYYQSQDICKGVVQGLSTGESYQKFIAYDYEQTQGFGYYEEEDYEEEEEGGEDS
ncbi:MAG: hypothetical protein EZS28_021790 [Streblomastix strix]|uniref:Uncharacterized protein n=1 Tax=Streblomastix strix TaxID=222440 RepID=A0A5J4VJR7_9EUKA|nr:MAG: hypothetical protein EZS28_021790 [Streblomastix strix]